MSSRADYLVLIGGASTGIYVWCKLAESNWKYLHRWTLLGLGGYGMYKIWQQMKVGMHKLCLLNATNINVGFRQKFKEEFVFLRARNTSESSNINTNKNIHMNRILAEKSIHKFITECGFTPYMFSSSTTQTTDSFDCHMVHSHRDFELPWTYKEITDKHVLCMMDVKHGYDLRDWLWMCRPIILYSFFPTKVGGICMDGIFSIKDNIITIQNKEGRRYQHQALYFDEDYFVVRGIFDSLVVTVDQYVDPCDPDRRVVCLTPISCYTSLANFFTPSHLIIELERMTYQCGRANMLLTVVQKENGETHPFMSIGFEDEPEQALLKYEEFMKWFQYNYTPSSLQNFASEKDHFLRLVHRKGWYNPKSVMEILLKYPTVGRIKVLEE